MSPRVRRIVITLAVLGLAGGVVLSMFLPRQPPAAGPESDQETAATSETPEARLERPGPDAVEAAPDSDPAAPPETSNRPSPTAPAPDAPEDRAPAAPPSGLHATWVDVTGASPQPLGSLDPREAKLRLQFSPAGAGLESITLSEHWQTAAASRRAAAHYEALDAGDRSPPPLPDDAERYVLQTAQPITQDNPQTGQPQQRPVPVLAADTVVIDGERVRLSNLYTDESGKTWALWAEIAPGHFHSTIVDDTDRPVARIERRFVIGDSYDITVTQRVTNLTDAPLRVQWVQYGPGDLALDRSRYMDRRRFRFGVLPDPQGHPDLVVSRDNDLLFERTDVLKRADKAAKTPDAQRGEELLTLWPNQTSREEGYGLSWFAATNRYFALAVHPLPDRSGPGFGGSRLLLEDVIEKVTAKVYGADRESRIVFTGLYSPVRSVAPGQETSFDLGVYAGPLDRKILTEREPLASLKMQGLILYQMSAFCAICTFQWLAQGLLWFLSAVYFVVRDWGLAIIILVFVVRTLLHPLTKKAQINMQRFGKVMGDLKPEIEKLQKKYKDEPKKLQQEQMRMMRERGVNPFQMLGCLPMFLQMPIWVALYAMLYFAFELRHEPAFWGVFQLFWGWPFLADLSSADHCLWEFDKPFKFLLWNVTGINTLPILMGLVFFFQQKYMSPPPSPSMTKEQLQQQKLMKVMMVVMFPVMLYSAPSGLTLYIFTSSLFGIIESRYIRRHIKEMDLAPRKPKPKPKRKPKDPQGRAFASAIERAKSKRQPPAKKYKKRR
ncbi:MAG: YidC/Oxa1 family insertase periplasmic-domain containing protein [Planctomycetota bacterium]|jgi:YidC/Oxa1 family membrane protein insertase